jgi:hypothetical protein
VLISADHNQFLHYYGQPEARLIRSYSVLPHQYPKPYGIFWLISVAALLGFLIFEFSHLNHVAAFAMPTSLCIMGSVFTSQTSRHANIYL